jgi:hypothetical protein
MGKAFNNLHNCIRIYDVQATAHFSEYGWIDDMELQALLTVLGIQLIGDYTGVHRSFFTGLRYIFYFICHLHGDLSRLRATPVTRDNMWISAPPALPPTLVNLQSLAGKCFINIY